MAVRLGNTVVTRTPCSASSARSESAKARSPNFDAAYADQSALAVSPAEEFTNTIVPPRAAHVRAAARAISTAGAMRLTSSCASQLAPARSRSTGARSTTPGHVQHRVDRAVEQSAEAVDGGRVGQVGHEHRRPGNSPAQLVGALVAAGQQARARRPGRRAGRASASADARPGTGDQVGARHRVKTTLPKMSPPAIAAKPSRACSIGMVRSISGFVPGGVEQR